MQPQARVEPHPRREIEIRHRCFWHLHRLRMGQVTPGGHLRSIEAQVSAWNDLPD